MINMPINSQAKGKRAEREVAKLINKYLGTNVRRTPQSGGMTIKGDIIDIIPDSPAYQFHFEIKDQPRNSGVDRDRPVFQRGKTGTLLDIHA